MANSLTDYEVSIIKNLLQKPEFTNQEIAGLINRYRGDAKSDVSSGRITNIKNNDIIKYQGVLACSEEDVRDFLDMNRNESPISDHVLGKVFPVNKSDSSRLNITETDHVECKEGFNVVMKTIAAFANNRGGYLVFGIKDKTWEIVGLSPSKMEKFREYDLRNLNQKIRSSLGADLQVQKKAYKIGMKSIGVMYIAGAAIKPLIFSKSDGKSGYSEGQIYYRYSGEDRLIAPLDLQRIIEDRIRDLSKTILTKHISQILKAGPTNAAVLNLETGEVDGAAGKFVVDQDLLKNIKIIKEGEFTESSGSPTLKLVGELTPIDYSQANVTIGNDPNAKKVVPKDPQKIWPLREKDIISRVKSSFDKGLKFSGHDLRCIKLNNMIDQDSRPDFVFKPHDMVAPQYSDKFADWIIEKVSESDDFISDCRRAFRVNGNSYKWK